MEQRTKKTPLEGHPEGSDGGLSWAAYLGAVSGLLVGVVMAMLASAYLHWWNPRSKAAEIFWEIAAPVLGVLGVVMGSLAFQRFFRRRLSWAVVLFALALAIGLFLAFGPVGFPWMMTGGRGV